MISVSNMVRIEVLINMGHLIVVVDIILVEDDPYYFQQFDLYDSKRQASSSSTYDVQRYLSTLVPSYLKYVYRIKRT
jgi:aromatic amino acid aminotransferase I